MDCNEMLQTDTTVDTIDWNQNECIY